MNVSRAFRAGHPAKAGDELICPEVQGFRPCGPGNFSLLAQRKVTKRKCPWGSQKRNGELRQRGDFPTRHPGSVGKRRTSMCAALRVNAVMPRSQFLEAKSEAILEFDGASH
jgi:hypothetical protein